MPKMGKVLQGSNEILDAIRPMIRGPRNPLEGIRLPNQGLPESRVPTKLPVQSSPENSPLNSPRQNQAGYDFTQSMNPQNQMMNPARSPEQTMGAMNQAVNPIRSSFQNKGGQNQFGDRMEQFRQVMLQRRPPNFEPL